MPRPPRSSAPALVQTLRFLKNPFPLIEETQRELGDVFSLRLLGLGEWVFLCSPEHVKEMFKAPTDVLAAGEVNAGQLGHIFGTDTTFALDGKAHLERRRIVHPQLNGRQVHQHLEIMNEVTERAAASWPAGRPFSFLEHGHRISLDILIHAMFRSSGRAQVERLAHLFDEFARKGMRSPLVAVKPLQVDLGRYSPWGKVKYLQRIAFDAFEKELAARLARRGETSDSDGENIDSDIVSVLIHARQSDGSYIPDRTLLNEVLTLLFAGHETTGNILTWALETILSRPPVTERLLAELDSVLGGGPVESRHLSELKYLDAVINESIRYRPLSPFAGIRLAKQEFAVGDYVIPPGMIVANCFSAMCQRRELFENPGEFDPDHFYDKKFRPFEWNPFGGGTRMCTGRGLAEVELKVVLATLLQRVTLRIVQKEVKAVRRGVFFAPSRGLMVTAERRTQGEPS